MVPVAAAWVILLLAPHRITSIPTSAAHVKALRKKLFETDEYDAKIRPAKDQNLPTEVSLSFYLLSINELNEVQETLKTTGFLALEWKDEFLQWNKSEFGGIEQYFFPQDDVWKPDVTLKNSFEKQKTLGLSTLNVQVTSTGDVLWYPFEVFESTCPIDSTYFPFDRQKCILTFVAWSYTKDEVKYDKANWQYKNP